MIEMPVTIPTKNKQLKYLGTNLTKKVKDLYNKKYKTLMKENEKDTKN
jgi:hypothetical protein